jgi:hypothetical protein
MLMLQWQRWVWVGQWVLFVELKQESFWELPLLQSMASQTHYHEGYGM